MYIGLLGSGQASADTMKQAYEVGTLIAQAGDVLVCGGVSGVFERAIQGSADHGGTSLVIAESSVRESVPGCTHLIPTGMGYARHTILANTCDGALIVRGWIGSVSLAAHFLARNKPLVALRGSGGLADSFHDEALIQESTYRIHSEDSPSSAFSTLIRMIRAQDDPI
ncbi:hypothetical protein GF324_03020 [bacterium]|nr:hypothetical protein [bacterium]